MQIHSFSDLEGLRIAVEMERRGGDFYRRAAKVSKDPGTAQLLSQLAQEETGHELDFQALYAREKERRGQGDEGVYDPETSAYLSAVAAEVVFPGGLMALAGENALQSPEAILKEAIQSEKDSILFYSELAALCRDEHTKSVFMDIVSQERRLLATLQRMLMALAGPAEE